MEAFPVDFERLLPLPQSIHIQLERRDSASCDTSWQFQVVGTMMFCHRHVGYEVVVSAYDGLITIFQRLHTARRRLTGKTPVRHPLHRFAFFR